MTETSPSRTGRLPAPDLAPAPDPRRHDRRSARTRAFWPVWSLIFVTVAAFAFGIPAQVPPVAALGGPSALVAVLLGSWTIAAPASCASACPPATRRLTASTAPCPAAPISALLDHPAIGAAESPPRNPSGPPTCNGWRRAPPPARAPEPDLRLSRQDPFALRYVAATAFAMALLFGTLGRVAEVG